MDDLQALWHSAQSAEDTRALPEQQINQMMRRNSRDEFNRFKRVVRWELIVNLPMSAGLIYLMTTVESLKNALMISSAVVALVIYGVWQYAFYRRMQRHSLQDDVHTYLTQGLAILKHYMRNYYVLIAFSGLFGAFIGIWMVHNSGPEGPPLLFSEDPSLNLVYSMFFATVMLGGVYLYVKYAYQSRINRMQQYRDQMNQMQQMVDDLHSEG